jgi:galactokinase
VINLEDLKSEFQSRYGLEPRFFRAPGRFNLIGEHTDYNEGYVLPAAIESAAYAAAVARPDRRIRVASMNYPGAFEFDLDDPGDVETDWTRYVQGIALILEREGFVITGAEMLIESDVPIGAGLSSSAALEISTALALSTLSGHMLDGMRLARIGQMAEHEFAGVRSGIMDQFTSVFGQPGSALFLDCRTMVWSPVQLSGARFFICNTKTKHDLAEGEYNKRRSECEEAAAFFGQKSLRDVTLEEFREREMAMMPIPRKRARHILTENERVLSSVDALRQGDLDRFAAMIDASHESLRDDFEVSSAELDIMVELAREDPRVRASRMTGGGFGGCAIALMRDGDVSGFADDIAAAYRERTGLQPEIYEGSIGGGASEVMWVPS